MASQRKKSARSDSTSFAVPELDPDAVLKAYQEIRTCATRLNNILVDRLSRTAIIDAAESLRRLKGERIELHTEGESAVLMDHAIYDFYRDGMNEVQRYLKESPPTTTLERQVLEVMAQARHGLFEVIATEPGLGMLVARVDSDEAPFFLVDRAFSATCEPGQQFALRTIGPFDGWWMSSGAALPVTPEGLAKSVFLVRKFVEAHQRPPNSVEGTTLMIRALITEGASEGIEYAKPKVKKQSPKRRRR